MDSSSPRPNTFGRALLGALVWVLVFGVLAVVLVAASDDSTSGEGIGALIGALLVPALLSALATWLISRKKPNRWPWWQLALVALPFFLVLRLLSVAGQASASGVT